MRKYAGLIVATVVGIPLGIYADVYNAHFIGISLLLVLGASAAMYDTRNG